MHLTLGACADVVLFKWPGDEAIVASSLGLLIGGREREGLISTACAYAMYPYNFTVKVSEHQSLPRADK